MQSSAGSRRREPVPVCPRTVQALREHRTSGIDSGPLRRSVGLLAVVTALLSAAPSGASLLPVDHHGPRVRTGTLFVPPHHGDGRVRVIVGLPLPPLAAAYGRSFAALGTTRRLNVATVASRRYLARVAEAQRVAAAQLVRAIPQ